MFAVLRIAVLAAVIVLAVTVLTWILTRDPRWKRRSWLVFQYSVYGLLVLLVLFAAEALFH